MNRFQITLAVGAGIACLAMACYPPWLKVQRTYEVFPVQQGDIVTMGHNFEVKEETTSFAGYHWRFTGPPEEEDFFWH